MSQWKLLLFESFDLLNDRKSYLPRLRRHSSPLRHMPPIVALISLYSIFRGGGAFPMVTYSALRIPFPPPSEAMLTHHASCGNGAALQIRGLDGKEGARGRETGASSPRFFSL